MRRILIALTSMVAFWPTAALAIDDKNDGDDPKVGRDGEITAEVSGTDIIVTPGGSGSGPRCDWDRLTTGEYERLLSTDVPLDLEEIPEIVELPDEPTPEQIAEHDASVTAADAAEQRNQQRIDADEVRRATPAVAKRSVGDDNLDFRVFTAECPGRAARLALIPPRVDDDELIVHLYDEIVEQITAPAPNISPPADVGGIVNLGLWIAIEPQQPIGLLTAEAGPEAWVTLSASQTSITFTPGDGTEAFDCDGTGDAIVDIDIVEESPLCGHTYERSTPDAAPHTITLGTNWSIPWTSHARSGELSYTSSVDIAYDIDELQTRGTG